MRGDIAVGQPGRGWMGAGGDTPESEAFGARRLAHVERRCGGDRVRGGGLAMVAESSAVAG
eukprot:scaffold28789_cov118-Isochrysis_galbana.AAC.3